MGCEFSLSRWKPEYAILKYDYRRQEYATSKYASFDIRIF
jgi:hypothetical protein